MPKQTPGAAARLTLAYLILAAGSSIMLLPLLWMTSAAFKPLSEIIRVPPTWIPLQPTLDNFRQVFAQFPFWRYIINSMLFTGVIVFSVLATSSLGGYAFAKFRFPGRGFLFLLILTSLMIPFQVRMVPLYMLMVSWKKVDTLFGLVFPWLFDATGIFLMRQFIAGIPTELIEAARIDGASELTILTRLILPNTKPALAALGIFTFSWSWEEFLWPLIISNSDATRTLPLALQYFAEQYGINIHWQMAGAFIATIPVLIVFLLLQCHFVEGITMTGMKG